MATGIEFDRAELGPAAFGNVHQPPCDTAAERAFDSPSHRGRGFARADDVDFPRFRDAESLAPEMLSHRALGVRSFQRCTIDSQRVADLCGGQPLFCLQGFYRINRGGAAGGEEAGEPRGNNQSGRGGGKRQWVERADSEQQGF